MSFATLATGGVSISIAKASGTPVPIPPLSAGAATPMPAKMAFMGSDLKVTSVNGSTILGTQIGSDTPITATVDVTTTYMEAGSSATLADVLAGSNIAVCGKAGDDGTIQASAVTILLPEIQGVITVVDDADFTVTGFDGASHIVSTTSATTVKQLDATEAISNLAVGSAVIAYGSYQSDHTLLAKAVDIQLPTVLGTVSAVNGDSITIDSAGLDSTGLGMQVPAIVTSSQTVYTDGDSTASASSVKVGSVIAATGTESADGTTLNALRVVVQPAGLITKAQGVTIGG